MTTQSIPTSVLILALFTAIAHPLSAAQSPPSTQPTTRPAATQPATPKIAPAQWIEREKHILHEPLADAEKALATTAVRLPDKDSIEGNAYLVPIPYGILSDDGNELWRYVWWVKDGHVVSSSKTYCSPKEAKALREKYNQIPQ